MTWPEPLPQWVDPFPALVVSALIVAAIANDFEGTVVQALLFFLLIGYAAGLTTHMAAAIDDMDAQPPAA